MSLTYKQKSRLGIMCALLALAGFVGGLAYLVVWSGETTSQSHFCSGTTGFTITNTHGDGQATTVNFNDPKCHGNNTR